eukprot:GDKJ01019960.1.p1 GENE.GDKJ01019960.1~~GDKJ01019960.1.p1  ORF type:complete len:211 (+),score=25.48 GDKJ01019960.1:27-659(+)
MSDYSSQLLRVSAGFTTFLIALNIFSLISSDYVAVWSFTPAGVPKIDVLTWSVPDKFPEGLINIWGFNSAKTCFFFLIGAVICMFITTCTLVYLSFKTNRFLASIVFFIALAASAFYGCAVGAAFVAFQSASSEISASLADPSSAPDFEFMKVILDLNSQKYYSSDNLRMGYMGGSAVACFVLSLMANLLLAIVSKRAAFVQKLQEALIN